MNCDNNQNNNGCGCNCNPNPTPAPADISMSVCDRNINMLPMLQTYTTKVLKPNIEGCCRKNILTQQMMNCEGYKYVIKWDFDLDGKTITVPSNCIIEFDGGSLKNGTIIGQNTVFINVGDVDIWGENLTREGTWREHSGGGGSGEEDKPYDPEAHSGLGRKTLQLKGDSNILTQDDFDQENTIYVITYDFDLNGETIEIPEGCILKFDGGSINNGKLIGNNTKILYYEGGSDALYGLYYDKNGDVLNYCYKKKSDFHINECYTFVDDMIDEDPAEYQSVAKYGNYLFVMGYPWNTAGATTPGHYQLFIRVFDMNDKYAFKGTAYTNVMSHANGATIVGNTLYVCPADGNKNEGSYINPERKCLHTFNCEDIVYAATHNISTPIQNGLKDLSYLESNLELSDGIANLDYIMGIDYDAVNKEFALDVNGMILFLDDNFGYLRKSENYRRATVRDYGFEVGTQDIAYKNGIVYCNFCSFDFSVDYRRTSLVNHPTILTIDSISGKLIDCQDIETPYHYWENQGAFKDGDDIMALFVSRKMDAVDPIQIKTYTIAKIATDIVTSKDTDTILKTDSRRQRFLGNGDYLEIFIDSTTSDTIQNGTYDHPFKTLEQGLHTVMTVSDNVCFKCRNGRTYKAQLGPVVDKVIRFQSYTAEGDSLSDTPIIDINGKFFNCYVLFQYVRIAPTKGFTDFGNACLVLNSTLFMMSDSSVIPQNYDASATDHNIDNWEICDGFVSSRNSKVDFINCTFVGLRHIIHSYRGVSATLDNVTYESIGNLVKADNTMIDVRMTRYDVSLYSSVEKLVDIAQYPFVTEPIVTICGHTIGNALTALAVAHKNDRSNIIAYDQNGNGDFVANSSAANGVPQWAKDVIVAEYDTTEENLNFNCSLYTGTYVYRITANVGRFESDYYHILGCPLIGTTEQRPLPKYPFMVRNGYEYFDTTLHKKIYWNGDGWAGAEDDNLFGKTINFLGDSYIANHNRPFEESWAYLLGQKHSMTINNYGINGNPIVATPDTGESMVERYDDMVDDVDYVIVVGGKNDYNKQLPIADFKTGLATLIEGLIEKYSPWNAERPSYCKIAFFTPWKIYVNDADDPLTIKLEEYVRAIIEVCNEYSIPVFDSAHKSGVVMGNAAFRARYCQADTDRSHLNSGGHIFFLPKAESFIESL